MGRAAARRSAEAVLASQAPAEASPSPSVCRRRCSIAMVTVPLLRLGVGGPRRRKDVQVPLITNSTTYRQVAERIVHIAGRARPTGAASDASPGG